VQPVTPETGRRRLAPEVRRRQVLDAAVAVFSEQGHDAPMDAVAARAGVSKPMVYAHGGSKEELFAACLRREADRLLASVTAAAAVPGTSGTPGAGTDEDARVSLRRALRAFFHAVTTRRQGWLVLWRQASTGPFAPEIAVLRGRIVDRAAMLLAAGVDAVPADVEPFAHTLVGAAEGLADWWLGRPAADPADPTGSAGDDPADVLADMLMTVVWPGLEALRRSAPRAPTPTAPSTIASSAVVSDGR
jgi:AcrR family transcriptional regulator